MPARRLRLSELQLIVAELLVGVAPVLWPLSLVLWGEARIVVLLAATTAELSWPLPARASGKWPGRKWLGALGEPAELAELVGASGDRRCRVAFELAELFGAKRVPPEGSPPKDWWWLAARGDWLAE